MIKSTTNVVELYINLIGKPVLWIDDVRKPPKSWVWAKTSAEAIEQLSENYFAHICFDHDLGGDDTTRPVVMWMIENSVWAESYSVHSSNPVGREWLEGMIERYLIL